MSQHNLNISNQGFPPTRADFNNALEALGSTLSGANPPTTISAGTLWFDTGNRQLKLRDPENAGWVIVAQVNANGTLQAVTSRLQMADQPALFIADQDGEVVAQIDSVGNLDLYNNSVIRTAGVQAAAPNSAVVLYDTAGVPILTADGATGGVTAALFTGDLDGDVNGDVTGNLFGNATTATTAERVRSTTLGRIVLFSELSASNTPNAGIPVPWTASFGDIDPRTATLGGIELESGIDYFIEVAMWSSIGYQEGSRARLHWPNFYSRTGALGRMLLAFGVNNIPCFHLGQLTEGFTEVVVNFNFFHPSGVSHDFRFYLKLTRYGDPTPSE